MTEAEFARCVRENPYNVELLARLPALGLPDCFLTAGCLFQAVWNLASGQAADWGIKDYDIFYFDDRDLSWETEDKVIRRIEAATADLPIKVEVKNQGRVHLWYPERFGAGYPQLRSAKDGIDRYLISCTCIGIDTQSGALYAPNGLAELAQGLLRMNPLNPRPDLFQQKAESYRSRWPWLSIVS